MRAPTKLVDERVFVVASNFSDVFILIGTLEPELQRGTYQAEPVVVVVVAMLVAVVAIPVTLPINLGDDNVPVVASYLKEVLMLIGTLVPELHRGTYQAVPVVVIVVAMLLEVVATPERLPVRAPTKLVDERVLVVAL